MKIIKDSVNISGMTCIMCQNTIESALNSTNGIISAKVDYKKEKALVEYDSDIVQFTDIINVIEEKGYEACNEKEYRRSSDEYIRKISILVIIIMLYILISETGIINMLVPGKLADSKMSYGMLFVVGLFTSVHCVAMCGGINLSQCIKNTGGGNYSGNTETGRYKKLYNYATVLYNSGRLISYTLTGFILGLLGMIVNGSITLGVSYILQAIVKLVAGICMIIMGINILGIFPKLSLYRIKAFSKAPAVIGKVKKRADNPFTIGLFNGLMPCGPLQSMQIVALATGNPIAGALSMLMFGLGTAPLMLSIGTIFTYLGKKYAKTVMSVGAVIVVVMGLAMLSQSGNMMGINIAGSGTQAGEQYTSDEAIIMDAVQIVRSTLESGTYPDITVKGNMPVRWIISADESSINGCNYKMVINKLGISHEFTEGDNIIEFTPDETGTIRYSCWMGMIHGNIKVVK